MTDRTHIGNAALQPIQSLQVFRGMAAVFVLLYHVHVISNTRYGIEFANGAFNMGNIGVDFFFVLSGFIIWFVHHKDMSQPERLPIYILKRFFRVWPLLAILTTFKLIYIFAGPGTGINQSKSSLETIVCSYFILPVPAGQPVLDVAWTLSHEMLFYIVITVGILFGKRILLLCFAVWMITIFICIFAPNGSLSYLTSFLFSLHGLQFMIGCLAAHLVSNRLHRTSAFVSTALGLVLVGFGLYSQLDIPIIHTYGLEAVFWAITFGLIIYGACCLERIYSLSFPEFLIFPGNASYSIYLFHTSIQVPAIIIMGRFGKSLNVSCQFQLWAVALVSLLGGIVAYLLIEKPILEKSRIWTGRILFRE